MSWQYQKWQMEAKAKGYPLCKDCHEPIPKARWGESDRCSLCYQQRFGEQLRRRDSELLTEISINRAINELISDFLEPSA